MIRYFEVTYLNNEVEYFGFMSTSTDRVIEFAGEQFFGDYAEFRLYIGGAMWDRCNSLIPERVKRG